MPRTNLCKADHLIATDKLIKWISRQEKQKVIAKAIGITEQQMSYRLKNKSFSIDELVCIFHFLGTEPAEIGRLMTY